jgi:hypothetical protein
VALDHSSQFHRVDLRNTPRVATEALVRAYPQLPNRLGEPATSLNSITDVLRESGRQVLATDLIDYEIEDPSCYGCDFLLAVGLSGYLHEPAFIKHLPQRFMECAFRLGAPLVVMLLSGVPGIQEAHLEGAGLEWCFNFESGCR